jgi:polar amino acid transport system permease protein
MIVYYGLPNLGINLGQMTSGIVALSLNSGAYVAEIFKAGIKSIKKGQTEASFSLGMTYGQTMRFVILPQAVRNILPALGNEFIALIKDSSLVSVIAIEELLRRGMIVYSRTYNAWTPLIGVAIIYLCMTIPLSRMVAFVEKRWEIND